VTLDSVPYVGPGHECGVKVDGRGASYPCRLSAGHTAVPGRADEPHAAPEVDASERRYRAYHAARRPAPGAPSLHAEGYPDCPGTFAVREDGRSVVCPICGAEHELVLADPGADPIEQLRASTAGVRAVADRRAGRAPAETREEPAGPARLGWDEPAPGDLVDGFLSDAEDEEMRERAEREGLRYRPGDQRLPVPNALPGVHDQLIELIEQRKQLGLGRYGTLLQAFNGRDSLKDVEEELVDALVYIRTIRAAVLATKTEMVEVVASVLTERYRITQREVAEMVVDVLVEHFTPEQV
jgi:hypothetical protein